MKSKLIKGYDLKQAVAEWRWQTGDAERTAQENMYRIGWKYKKSERQEEVWKGDIVTVSLRGNAKKFNRTTKIRVGAYLFDESLEKDFIGKQRGKTYAFLHETGEVLYRIEEIQRLVVPYVTDEMAAAEEIEGITTERELYRYYLTSALREKFSDESYVFLEKHYLLRCDFSIEAGDIGGMIEREMERCRGIAKRMNRIFEEMSEEELSGAVGCRNIDEFKKMLYGHYDKMLRSALVAAEMSGEDESKVTADNIFDYYKLLIEKTVNFALEKMQNRSA